MHPGIVIGNICAFSYVIEPRQKISGVKSSRQRTQTGQSVWEKKPVKPDLYDKYPQALILHNNWENNVHALNLNNLSQQEINYITALIDPFFAEEIIKKDMRIQQELQRLPKDLNVTNPYDFYLRFIKSFIKLYDSYRRYNPQKMINIKVIKRYSDIQQKLQYPIQPTGKQPSGVIDTSTRQGSSFFDRYVNSISRLRGPKFKF